MAVLVSEGFEATLAELIVAGWNVWGTPEIQGAIKYSGLSALKCKAYDVAYKQIPPVNQITVEEMVYIDTLPPVSAAGDVQAKIILLQTAAYDEVAMAFIYDQGGGTVVGVYSPLGWYLAVAYAFQPNTWYKFKLEYDAAVSGGWRLSINDVEVINVLGSVDTSSLRPELVYLPAIPYTGNIYVDDVVVSDVVSVTPPPTTYPVSYAGGTPIAVPLSYDSQQLVSGTVQLPAGTITISVPSEVNA